MEASVHRFVRLLRLAGLRISVSETVDALRCAAAPGVLSDREVLRSALSAALVKDARDMGTFDEVFDAFFALVQVPGIGHDGEHSHAHDALSDRGGLERYTISEEPSATPQQGHEHGKPVDIRDYFDPRDLAEQFNLHQDANKIDLAAMTDQIVLSDEGQPDSATGNRIQLEARRLHGAGLPGRLADPSGTRVDADLSVAEQEALLGWLNAVEDAVGDEADAARLRRHLSGVVAGLPEAIKHHLEALLALERAVIEAREQRALEVDPVGEAQRAELELSLRRLARTLHGAITHRRQVAASGRIDSARTMRRNMRFDGVPFAPVTVRRAEDRPRLVVLTDVSLSVRSTARFTLQLVHGLHDLFAQVRSFAFVADLAEVTELFGEHGVDTALELIFGGEVLDVDATSDYGQAFGAFLADHASAVTHRTTVLVLGDGRGNGHDPNLAAFEEITRRARETIWLTPEPRYSWSLGGCDLPRYAEHCDRVRVVRDLPSLEHTALDMLAETAGR